MPSVKPDLTNSPRQVSEAEIREIIAKCRTRLEDSPKGAHHPDNIMDTANFNIGQYRISWCVRGDNTPEFAKYLGYLNIWQLYPELVRGRSLKSFFQSVLKGAYSE